MITLQWWSKVTLSAESWATSTINILSIWRFTVKQLMSRCILRKISVDPLTHPTVSLRDRRPLDLGRRNKKMWAWKSSKESLCLRLISITLFVRRSHPTLKWMIARQDVNLLKVSKIGANPTRWTWAYPSHLIPPQKINSLLPLMRTWSRGRFRNWENLKSSYKLCATPQMRSMHCYWTKRERS